MAKKQLYIIHGGDFFDSRKEFAESLRRSKVSKEHFLFDDENGWKENLAIKFSKSYEVFYPKMPNKYDAKYEEWKIWFEKSFKFLKNGVVLVGHSLGGIFLARYLSENKMPVSIRALFLIAAPYFMRKKPSSCAGFSVNSVGKLKDQVENIFIYHSKDDPIVAFSHAKRYAKALPKAIFREFSDRGHFIGESLIEVEKDIEALG